MSNSKTISFDINDFKKFKDAYNEAKIDHKESFKFKRELYLVSYAKYLIEFLEPKFNSLKK